MSTHSVKPAMHRGIVLPVRFVSGVVLILTALFLLLPSVAFAFVPTVTEADPTQNVAQAGVSVVRLVVSYTGLSTPGGMPPSPAAGPLSLVNNASTFQCTGLGVLVGSWAATGTEKSSWVLTDGNLVNPMKMTCTSSTGGSVGGPLSGSIQLTQIEVLASSGTGGYAPPSTVPLARIAVKAGDVTCEDSTSCSQGPALFGFSTAQAQPYIDLSSSSAGSDQQGIELTNPSSALLVSPSDATQYLTPHTAPVDAQTDEAGMPIVDAQGKLTGLHLVAGSSSLSFATIMTFLNQNIPQGHPNVVHDNWDNGIRAYYAREYAAAQKDFQLAAAANSQFLAATVFMEQAAAQVKSGNGGGVGSGGSGNTRSPTVSNGAGGLLGFSLWQVSVVALVVLLLIVVVISLLVGRARRKRELEQFKEDEKAAEHRAAVEAHHIASMEAQQRQVQEQGIRNGRLLSPVNGEVASSPPVPLVNAGNMQPYPAQISPQMSPVLDMRCPQCGNAVAANAQLCPHCNTWLSPSDSGLHLRAMQPQPGTDMGMAGSLPPVPPPYQQPPMPSQPPIASPASAYGGPDFSMADKPTVLFGFSRDGQEDGEKTVPYNIRRVGSANLGLAVGTRTDPGIKRKHKPNEDSLFAAQGAGMFNASPQPYGLFVIADGMGGHANGQDASRLAIQTIIDYLLPRLSAGSGLDRNALVQLLVEGVQRANQAVFQSNMEHHADMGTTMTTALVVGATAYVANVGDSRTYLYREPEGLTKITNDHSVVASLVEAGIIKPDDIYTHPKRNQIYRSLGEKPAVEVDSFIVDLRPDDKLLLCTDGLWDMVRDPAIEEVLHSAAANPDQTGEALIHAALQGGGEDNVSVIVVYVKESAQQATMAGIQLLAKPETVQMPPM